MDKPLFSIIVPIYNASKYLADCVNSVLMQEMNNYELILVDDGSTDDSINICDAFSEKNETVKVFHKVNEGPIPTRLFGLKHAKGKYVVHLDADDYLERDTLKNLESAFEKYQCDCIIYGFRSFMEDKTLRVYTVDEDFLLTSKHEICLRIFSSFEYNALWRKAYKRDVVDHGDLSRFYHFHKGEDLLLSLGILRCCSNVLFTKKILYNYRMNDESITHRKELLPRRIEFTLPEIVLNFIRDEAGFNEGEIDDYRKTRYKDSFIPLIKRIVIADAPRREKVQLFKKISETKYYKGFLSKRIVYSYNNMVELCILLLFRYKLYSILVVTLQYANKTILAREQEIK